jgi:hypothetical protein
MKFKIFHVFLIVLAIIVLAKIVGFQGLGMQAVFAPTCTVDYRFSNPGEPIEGDWIGVDGIGYGWQEAGTDNIELFGTPINKGDWDLYPVNDATGNVLGFKVYENPTIDNQSNDIYNYYTLADPDSTNAILYDLPLVGFEGRESYVGDCAYCGDNICDYTSIGSLGEEPVVPSGAADLSYAVTPEWTCEADCGIVHYCGDGVCDLDEVSNYGFGLYAEICDNGDSIDDSYNTTKECMSDCQSCTETSNTNTTSTCGDGSLDIGESCDGTNLNSKTCITQGYNGGTLGCLDNCAFNETACTNVSTTNVCGDNIKGVNEICDGTDLAGHTCSSEGFDSGTLKCDTACNTFITEDCSKGGFFTKYKWYIIILGGLAITGFMMGPKKIKKLIK